MTARATKSKIRTPAKKPEVPTKKLTWRQVEKVVETRTLELQDTRDRLLENLRHLEVTVTNFQNLLPFRNKELEEARAALEQAQAEQQRLDTALSTAQLATHDADLKRLDAEETVLRFQHRLSVERLEREEERISGMIAGIIAIIASGVAVVQACL